jgi:hypothetical protein
LAASSEVILMSITADLDVGAVAVEELISLGLLEQPVAVNSARTGL